MLRYQVSLFSLCCLLAIPALATETLTNSDVQAMAAAGLSEAVIISKIEHAESASFNLEVDDLIALKEAGLSPEVIRAMLKWSDPAARPTPPPGPPPVPQQPLTAPDWQVNAGLAMNIVEVALETEDGELPIRLQRGDFSQSGFGPFRLSFMDYHGLHARVRTQDKSPVFIVRTIEPVTKNLYFLAHLDVDHNDEVRSLKISSAKRQLKAAFGGSSRGIIKPDADWVIKWSAEEIEEGVWRLQPTKPLKPGEYGIYIALGSRSAQGGGLFGFGVD